MDSNYEKLYKLMDNLHNKIIIFEEKLLLINQKLQEDWNENHIQYLKEETFLKKTINEYYKYKEDYNFYSEVMNNKSLELDKQSIDEELEKLYINVEKYMISLFFSEEEMGDCYLELQSGTGGADAEDLTVLLLNMYKSWTEKTNRNYKILDIWPTDNGIRSVFLKIEGENSYGFLKFETGIHRIVRYSPFNALDKRQTSFIAVYAYPVLEEKQIIIEEKDLIFEFCRSSGAGGQHVNKTESAVRVTHKPTGLVVRCENERSQMMNKQMAIKLLKAKLITKEKLLKQEKENTIDKTPITWGQQIRSYVFNPYKLIKDLRSQYETKNIEKFLNGELLDECLYTNILKFFNINK